MPELHVPTAVTLCTRRTVVHGITFTVAAMSVAVLALAGLAGASPSGVATGSVVITWLLRLAAIVGVITLHSRFRVSWSSVRVVRGCALSSSLSTSPSLCTSPFTSLSSPLSSILATLLSTTFTPPPTLLTHNPRIHLLPPSQDHHAVVQELAFINLVSLLSAGVQGTILLFLGAPSPSAAALISCLALAEAVAGMLVPLATALYVARAQRPPARHQRAATVVPSSVARAEEGGKGSLKINTRSTRAIGKATTSEWQRCTCGRLIAPGTGLLCVVRPAVTPAASAGNRDAVTSLVGPTQLVETVLCTTCVRSHERRRSSSSTALPAGSGHGSFEASSSRGSVASGLWQSTCTATGALNTPKADRTPKANSTPSTGGAARPASLRLADVGASDECLGSFTKTNAGAAAVLKEPTPSRRRSNLVPLGATGGGSEGSTNREVRVCCVVVWCW